MRKLLVSIVALGLAASGPALAQSSSSANSQPNSQSNAQASGPSAQQMVTAQKLRQDLEKAGFTNVSVVAESFVVQAKTKDGDPVLMTIGPHGMTLFEASNLNNKPATTGSTGSSASSGGSKPSGSSGSK